MEYFCEICGKKLTGRQRKYCSECVKSPYRGGRKKAKKEKPKGYLEGLKAKTNINQCKTCGYWNKEKLMCDYYFITGKLRLCEPPPNCTKYDKNPMERQRMPFSLYDSQL